MSVPDFWQRLLSLDRPLIMGILNVTPDSFADGGSYYHLDAALQHARSLVAAGADILDVGGESTRPFSDPVPLDEELRRVLPVIQALRADMAERKVAISIDTYKAEVARQALAAGAHLINDISALRFDPLMVKVAAHFNAPVILMHMQGTPKSMQADPRYQDLLAEIKSFLAERRDFALAHGLPRESIVLDPGIGFGKTFGHNLTILNHFDTFLELGCPLLVGPSRKAFIGHYLGGLPPDQRDIGTLAPLAMAVLKGAKIVRVHNVSYASQFLTMLDVIRRA